MINSAKSQAAAQVATTLSTRTAKIAVKSLGVPDVSNGPASAYAYVPKQAFGNYGAEQIALQVEDFNFPPAGMGPIVRTQLAPTIVHMSALVPGTSDAANVLGLSTARFEFENTPGVVWHAQS